MYRSILVPVDLEQPSSWEKALPTAVALRQAFGASLALVTAVPEPAVMFESQWSPIAQREMLEVARARLGSLASSVDGAGEVTHHVEMGGIYSTILSIGERIGADLIVLSSHRPAMRDYLLGANDHSSVSSNHARFRNFTFTTLPPTRS